MSVGSSEGWGWNLPSALLLLLLLHLSSLQRKGVQGQPHSGGDSLRRPPPLCQSLPGTYRGLILPSSHGRPSPGLRGMGKEGEAASDLGDRGDRFTPPSRPHRHHHPLRGAGGGGGPLVALPLGVPGEPRSGHTGGVFARGGGSAHPIPRIPPAPTHPRTPHARLQPPPAAPPSGASLPSPGRPSAAPASVSPSWNGVQRGRRWGGSGSHGWVPGTTRPLHGPPCTPWGLHPPVHPQIPGQEAERSRGASGPVWPRQGRTRHRQRDVPPTSVPSVPHPLLGARPAGTCSGGVCSAGSLGSSCCRRRCRAGGGRSPGHAGTTRLAGWHRSPVRGAGRPPSSHLLERDPRTSARRPLPREHHPPLGARGAGDTWATP